MRSPITTGGQGLTQSSRERLEDDHRSLRPSDVVALTNLGNIAEASAATPPWPSSTTSGRPPRRTSATLLFDLSQAYANAFRMEEYEATLVRAQRVDGDAVAALSSLDDAALVADLGYPIASVRNRLVALAFSADGVPSPLDRLAPGLLGGSWWRSASAFALVALLGLLIADRWDHASLCVRCGHRICTRCEETVWSEEICEDCHHLLQYPEATDPSLRMARLQALSVREARLDRIWVGLSLLVPGVAGMAARRPDLSLLGLVLFAWSVTWIAWPRGPFADPMWMGSVASIGFAVSGVIACLGYVAVVATSLIVRKAD